MPTARDLLLTDGDLAVIGQDFALVYDNDAIAQQATIALQTFAGEVFFDTTAGAGWWNLLGVKAAGIENQFAAEAKRVLLDVPGITSVQNVRVLNTSSRVATITAQCLADSGVLLTINAQVAQG
jgi:tRNA(Leu) C34 or U34 (ribose-2'-O)-methylase TrmL